MKPPWYAPLFNVQHFSILFSTIPYLILTFYKISIKKKLILIFKLRKKSYISLHKIQNKWKLVWHIILSQLQGNFVLQSIMLKNPFHNTILYQIILKIRNFQLIAPNIVCSSLKPLQHSRVSIATCNTKEKTSMS